MFRSTAEPSRRILVDAPRRRPVRELNDVVTPGPINRRPHRRLEAGAPAQRHARRRLLHGRAPAALFPVDGGRLWRAGLPGHRQRLLQAQRLGHGRRPLPRGQPAQGPRLQHLLHGHQHRGLPRPGLRRARQEPLGLPHRLAYGRWGMAISLVISRLQARHRAPGRRFAPRTSWRPGRSASRPRRRRRPHPGGAQRGRQGRRRQGGRHGQGADKHNASARSSSSTSSSSSSGWSSTRTARR